MIVHYSVFETPLMEAVRVGRHSAVETGLGRTLVMPRRRGRLAVRALTVRGAKGVPRKGV